MLQTLNTSEWIKEISVVTEQLDAAIHDFSLSSKLLLAIGADTGEFRRKIQSQRAELIHFLCTVYSPTGKIGSIVTLDNDDYKILKQMHDSGPIISDIFNKVTYILHVAEVNALHDIIDNADSSILAQLSNIHVLDSAGEDFLRSIENITLDAFKKNIHTQGVFYGMNLNVSGSTKINGSVFQHCKLTIEGSGVGTTNVTKEVDTLSIRDSEIIFSKNITLSMCTFTRCKLTFLTGTTVYLLDYIPEIHKPTITEYFNNNDCTFESKVTFRDHINNEINI